jgi:hypothetical protein
VAGLSIALTKKGLEATLSLSCCADRSPVRHGSSIGVQMCLDRDYVFCAACIMDYPRSELEQY